MIAALFLSVLTTVQETSFTKQWYAKALNQKVKSARDFG